MREVKLAEVNNCTGCSACYSICPTGAIKMVDSDKGFPVPSIDANKCVKCLQCVKTCPELNSDSLNYNDPIKSYLGKNEDSVRMKSSSGGLFLLFADKTLESNGKVFGAEMKSDMTVSHSGADTKEEAIRFCGSKYIQSNISDSFKEVYNTLNEGKSVYFSGTACQVAGLYKYLESKRCSLDNLITQDFICHGVGSPKFFKEYISTYEKKFRSRVTDFNFRGKPKPGRLQTVIMDFENGKRYISPSTNQDVFYYHFLNNLILKPSCFSCKYAKVGRVADITLADCFNVKDNVIANDGRGISYVQINTEKGMKYLEQLRTANVLVEVDTQKYIQPNMKNPSPKNAKYDLFWEAYNAEGFKSAIRKYGNGDFKSNLKRSIIYIVSKTNLDSVFRKRVQ